MKHYLIAIIGLFMFLSCKNDKAATKTVGPQMDKKEVPANKYVLTPFTKSPSYGDATLSNMSYKDGKFDFDVVGTNYKLGMQTPDAGAKMCANSAKGQHIHLIVDNSPYSAQYTSDFEYDIEDGEHTIMAFLSRSYHESIKTNKAHLHQKVMVKDKSIISTEEVKEARVTYSRPKGTYVGNDTNKVMLDFYLSNVDLESNGYNLKAIINGETHKIEKWQPYYIEGLPMGENKVTLTLMKGSSEVNSVTRLFTTKADISPEK